VERQTEQKLKSEFQIDVFRLMIGQKNNDDYQLKREKK